MKAVAYSTFRKDLKNYMRKINDDADTILVTNTNPADNVIVMSADDYDSLMETMRVYQNQYLRDKILNGMRQVKTGTTSHHNLIEA